MPEELFEWIVISGKQKYCLTENQYDLFLKSQSNRVVVFETFSINPAYVSSCYKQKARELKKLYPCMPCNKSGSNHEYRDGTYTSIECEVCKGTGIDLKAKVTPLMLEDEN